MLSENGCNVIRDIIMVYTMKHNTLRAIAGAPWFVENDTIHYDLRLRTVSERFTFNLLFHLYYVLHLVHERIFLIKNVQLSPLVFCLSA